MRTSFIHPQYSSSVGAFHVSGTNDLKLAPHVSSVIVVANASVDDAGGSGGGRGGGGRGGGAGGGGAHVRWFVSVVFSTAHAGLSSRARATYADGVFGSSRTDATPSQ